MITSTEHEIERVMRARPEPPDPPLRRPLPPKPPRRAHRPRGPQTLLDRIEHDLTNRLRQLEPAVIETRELRSALARIRKALTP